MLQEKKTIKASAEEVWESWQKSHFACGGIELKNGAVGNIGAPSQKSISYSIANVVAGRSFSTVWKLFLVRLHFHYAVAPTHKNLVEITYGFNFKGPLGWALRFLLLNKMRRHLKNSLNAFIESLKDGRERNADRGRRL